MDSTLLGHLAYCLSVCLLLDFDIRMASPTAEISFSLYGSVCLCVCVYMCRCIYDCMHVCVNDCMGMYVHMFVSVCVSPILSHVISLQKTFLWLHLT